MHCWLIEIGEPLPFDPGPPRLMRTGLLAEHLARAGHQVVWWASRFDHVRRMPRPVDAREVAVGQNLSVRLLDGHHYQRSVGLNRIRHHRAVAADFARLAPTVDPPDIILCGVPTLELAAAAVCYGESRRVPVLLDLRDMWPDMFFEMMPRLSRPLARLLARGVVNDFAATSSRATGLMGITGEFLDWGLAYAGRPRRSTDCVAPHAYPSTKPPLEAIEAAQRAWDAKGVTSDPEAFVVSFVGTLSRRLTRQGFLQDAVEAASILTDACPNLKLVICGGGEDLERWSRLAASKTNVVVSGHVDHPELWTLLSRSRLGLVPYPNSLDFSRSIPNKVGEYLSMGVPITSSLDGTLGRFLREQRCGETYPAGNPTMLAQIWRRVHDDKAAWGEMSRRARDAHAAHLSADVVYPELVTHLERVASGRTAEDPLWPADGVSA